MESTSEHTVEETRAAILEQLSEVRDDLVRHRRKLLHEASKAWFDLAIGYARVTRLPSYALAENTDARRTAAELDESLRRCAAEEIRLREMLEEFDVRVALFAQGKLPEPPADPRSDSTFMQSALRLVRRLGARLHAQEASA